MLSEWPLLSPPLKAVRLGEEEAKEQVAVSMVLLTSDCDWILASRLVAQLFATSSTKSSMMLEIVASSLLSRLSLQEPALDERCTKSGDGLLMKPDCREWGSWTAMARS